MWILQLSISKAGQCRIGTNEYIVCILQIAAEPKKTQTYSLQNQNLLIFSYFLVYNLSYFASHTIFFPTVIAAYQKQLCLIGVLFLRDQAQGCSISSFCFYF